jgi:hypothetical protein
VPIWATRPSPAIQEHKTAKDHLLQGGLEHDIAAESKLKPLTRLVLCIQASAQCGAGRSR